MITVEWFEDMDGTIYCSLDCTLWNVFMDECAFGYDKEDEDIGVPGKDCPGPGEYEVTLKKDQSKWNLKSSGMSKMMGPFIAVTNATYMISNMKHAGLI